MSDETLPTPRVTQEMLDAELRKLPTPWAVAPMAPPKLTTAIAAVMGEIGVVGKGGTNEFFKYKFVQMGDVLQVLTPLMAKHGVVVVQYENSKSFFDDGRAIAMEYRFVVAHSSGEVWPDLPTITGVSNCRNRNGTFDDKCLNKCHTAARKYFLMGLFQVPTGDVDDADEGKNDGRRAPEPAPDARRAPEPAPDAMQHEFAATPMAAPAEAVDQETGKILPYKIQTEKRHLGDFAADYAAGVNSARTLTDLAEWQLLNKHTLEIVARRSVPLQERIVRLHQETYARLNPGDAADGTAETDA